MKKGGRCRQKEKKGDKEKKRKKKMEIFERKQKNMPCALYSVLSRWYSVLDEVRCVARLVPVISNVGVGAREYAPGNGAGK